MLVEGRLIPDESGNPRTFTRNDGSPGASFEVNAQRVVFLSGGTGGGFDGDDSFEEAPDSEDEIPF